MLTESPRDRGIHRRLPCSRLVDVGEIAVCRCVCHGGVLGCDSAESMCLQGRFRPADCFGYKSIRLCRLRILKLPVRSWITLGDSAVANLRSRHDAIGVRRRIRVSSEQGIHWAITWIRPVVGLGMSLSALVGLLINDIMGGFVTVTSQLHAGTKVHVTSTHPTADIHSHAMTAPETR